ncbi:AraC family transcriptional regulator [Paenibacillus sp. HB172176]|uniref:helix-turn-helix domain-containing protein n=1 Tax=Paenibacillus sp. HB172176 TaxID=2493690 RepID=UPI00143AD6F8|nr:AraC family transcriptional regulator [Paenibacillus sp. HB172176]
MIIFYNDANTIKIDYRIRSGSFTMEGHHAHDSYELYYLFSGERDFFIRDRTYRVRQGSFAFVEKEELHRTIDTGTSNHERIVINFTDALLFGLPRCGHNGVITLPPQEQFKGEAILRELVAETQGDAEGRDVMLEALLRQLLLLVFRAQTKSSQQQEHQPSAVHRMMSEIASYISANCEDSLLLKDVAERFFISPYYLSRKFKQCTGFGFAEYVQLVRIREAQRLLRETNLAMLEVADRCGIGALAHFHKLFKRISGCSPLQYRKRYRA